MQKPVAYLTQNFKVPKYLVLGEQEYFVWNATSQSTKWRNIIKIWGECHLGPPWLRLW